MPRTQEIATIVASGQQYGGWKTVEVRRAYGAVASVFTFPLEEVGAPGKGWRELKLKPSDLCQI